MKKIKRIKICLRNITGDEEGKDQSNESSNSDDMAFRSLIDDLRRTRMSLSNSSSNSMSTFTSTSIHNNNNNNNNNVPLIPDERKKGIYTDTVKPLSKFSRNHMNREIGEPSCYYCVICGDVKPFSSTTVRGPCKHCYCLDCFQVYVAGKIQENALPRIDCPEKDCEMKLSSHFWLKYVPEEVYERKQLAYLESVCLAYPRGIKCPNCLFMFLDDRRFFLIRACTNCWSVICIMCEVSWHLGISCTEFQQLQRLRFDF